MLLTSEELVELGLEAVRLLAQPLPALPLCLPYMSHLLSSSHCFVFFLIFKGVLYSISLCCVY